MRAQDLNHGGRRGALGRTAAALCQCQCLLQGPRQRALAVRLLRRGGKAAAPAGRGKGGRGRQQARREVQVRKVLPWHCLGRMHGQRAARLPRVIAGARALIVHQRARQDQLEQVGRAKDGQLALVNVHLRAAHAHMRHVHPSNHKGLVLGEGKARLDGHCAYNG